LHCSLQEYLRQGIAFREKLKLPALSGREVKKMVGPQSERFALPEALQSLKVKVPAKMRVFGFDDMRYAALLPVSLTTTLNLAGEIAEVAFRGMQDTHPNTNHRSPHAYCGAPVGGSQVMRSLPALISIMGLRPSTQNREDDR